MQAGKYIGSVIKKCLLIWIEFYTYTHIFHRKDFFRYLPDI